jgi:predicted NUDIX family NTP pyrophosphohydrolase
MKLISAGLIMYRKRNDKYEYLLVHNGGPFFSRKDDGAWTIPKGILEPGEELLAGAQREFKEETSFDPKPPFIELGSIEQKNNKTVHAWAFEGDADTTQLKSNMMSMEWPPRSGKTQTFPEVDRGQFFTAEEAHHKMNTTQFPLIERLEKYLKEHATA